VIFPRYLHGPLTRLSRSRHFWSRIYQNGTMFGDLDWPISWASVRRVVVICSVSKHGGWSEVLPSVVNMSVCWQDLRRSPGLRWRQRWSQLQYVHITSLYSLSQLQQSTLSVVQQSQLWQMIIIANFLCMYGTLQLIHRKTKLLVHLPLQQGNAIFYISKFQYTGTKLIQSVICGKLVTPLLYMIQCFSS